MERAAAVPCACACPKNDIVLCAVSLSLSSAKGAKSRYSRPMKQAWLGVLLMLAPVGPAVAQRRPDAGAAKPAAEPPPIQPTGDELRQVQAKTDELAGLLRTLAGKKVNDDLYAD